MRRGLPKQLKNGACIEDVSYHGDERFRRYLWKLPVGTPSYLYGGGIRKKDIMGSIYSKSKLVVGNWHEAVAGIAFGGLVPLAAVDLVDAVRFTATGDTDFSSQERLDFFMNFSMLIWEV